MKANLIELQLHEAIKNKDDLALTKLYDLYGDKIFRTLKSWYRNVAKRDDALLYAAVNEAFFGYYYNPVTFNPQQSTLQRFLEIAADRDLKNILRKEKKHASRQDLPEDVELQQKLWNSTTESYSSTDAAIITDETTNMIRKMLENYFPTDKDVAMAWMVISRERNTEPFSKVLEIENWSIPDQRIEVKKHKDRIKKVLERHDVEPRIKNLFQ